MDVADLGFRVDSGQVDKASRSLDNLSQSARKTETATERMNRENAEASKRMKDMTGAGQSAMRMLGRMAALGLVVSAGMAIRGTIGTVAQFGQSMAEVSAITRATGAELKQMTMVARQLGATTEYTAAQAASAFKFLGMAGFTAKESIAAIPDVLNLATAAALDLGAAADIASNVMSGFGISATNASRVTDVLAAASSRANTDVAQLGSAIAYVGPVAAAMGVDIGDAAAAIGVLSDAGIQGSSAGIGLRRVLSSLANPTKDAADIIRKLGLDIESVNPATNELTSIIDTLAKTGMSAADALTIFGDRGGPAILALVENNARLKELAAELSNVEGESKRMADTMRDTLKMDALALGSAMQELALVIGGAQESSMRGALQSTTGFVRDLGIELQAFTTYTLESGEAATAASADYITAAEAVRVLLNVINITAIEFQDLGDWIGYVAARAKLAAEAEVAARTLQLGKARAINAQIMAMDKLRAERRQNVEIRITDAIAAQESASRKLRAEMQAGNQAAEDQAAGYLSMEAALAQLNKTGGKTPKVMDDIGGSTGRSSAEIEKTIESLEKQIIELTKGERALFAFENANDAAALALYDQVKALEADKEATEAAKKAKEDYRNELQSLTDKLYPQAAAVRALMMEYLLLNQAIINGDFGKNAVHDWLDLNVAIDDTPRILKEVQKETTAFGKIWDTTIERLQGGIADMFFDMLDRGKVTFDNILNLFKRMVAEMAAQKFVMSIGLGGGSSGAVAAGLGGGGGFDIMSLGSWVSAGKSLWSGFSGMLNGQGLSGFAGMFGGSAVDSLMVPVWNLTREAAQQTAAMTNAVNTWGPILAGIGGAIQGWQTGNKLNAITGAAGGYGGAVTGAKVGGAIGSVVPVIGTAIGSAIGTALGAILGSSIGRSVFGTGYKTTGGGIQLGFGEEGFDPQQWARQSKKGGWFRSNKSRMIYDELDSELDMALNTAYTATIDGIAQMYQAIGVGVTQATLEGVQIATLNIDTFGKSEQTQEEIKAQIAQWFNELSDAVIKSVDAGLSYEALQELAMSITTVNPVLDVLGLNLLTISKDGAWAAKELLRVSGGIEALAASTEFYYQNFYSENERLAASTAQVSAAMASLGLSMPTTNAGFRAIVEGLDLMTVEGRDTFAALMQLAPAFDAVTKGAEQAAQAAEQAAAALRNTLTDMAGTAFAQYNNTLAERASLEDQLMGINQEIADLMAEMATSSEDTGSALDTVATTVNTITSSVDELVYSSSQLRGWADSLRSTVNSLMLSDLSPLTNSARLQEAQRQFASAQVTAEETGDMSGLSGAAQTYLKEAASYYASSGPYIAIFGEVTGYLSSMAGKAETEAQRAERIESIQAAQAEAQRIATEAVTGSVREADTASRTAAQQQQQQLQLQTLLAEQQRIELALANSYAIDTEGVLSAQLQAMIDVNAGVQSMAQLLSMLPGELAAAIGGAVGIAPQQYGGDLVNQLYQQVLGRNGEASGVAYWQSVQQQGFGTENLVRAFINAAQQNGQSPLMGADDFLAGLPQFAGGGIADGPSTGYPVTLHGREAVIPMNGQAITVQQPELVAEVQALRQEVSRLREDNNKHASAARQQRGSMVGEQQRTNSRLARGSKVETV